ncbi:GAF domain-containing protein [Streptomyces buecherae]|uniref:GAF domain-containing protein n=1 Tax=Streptomyces buecherae TaxID=2763006 RepID=UPI00378B7FB1
MEAVVALADAEYGALGVIGDGQQLWQFLPVGIADELISRISQAPCGRGILGELIHAPVPLRLTDLTRHPASYGLPEHHPPMRTFLGVPIRVRDEVFGNLYLTENRGTGFDADDESVLTTLANAAGVAIDNARICHESRRREQWLQALGETTRSLLAGTEVREVLRLIARRASEVVGADQAVVLLLARADDVLTAEVAHGPDAEQVRGLRLPGRGSLAGLAARTGVPVATADIHADPRAHSIRDAGDGAAAYRPAMAVPPAAGLLGVRRDAAEPAYRTGGLRRHRSGPGLPLRRSGCDRPRTRPAPRRVRGVGRPA